MSEVPDSHTANIRRGGLLIERSRYKEALPFFQQAQANDPMDGYALSQVAICQVHLPEEREKALYSINAAIGVEPDNESHYGLKAMILCQLALPKKALEATREGIALQPDDPFLCAAEAQAYLTMQRWANAEESARKALALDPDYDLASNQLVQALYEQRECGESRRRILDLLANKPEDPHAHYNAGYSYLQSGDQRKSLEHFTECLRLDPTFEAAQIGILEAMRARYAVYRWYLKMHFTVDAWSKRLKGSEWLLPLVIPVILASALIQAVATFFLLFDRRARLALDFNDKMNGILGGGGILLGLGLMGVGLVTTVWILFKVGAVLSIATVAIAYELANAIPERLRM